MTKLSTHENVYAALAAAQAEMPPAVFNKTNPHFKSRYADLASLRAATLPVMGKHGLAIHQFTGFNGEGVFVLFTRVAHESGQCIEPDGQFPLPNCPDKPQVLGSALTYARRYGWGAALGEASDEDDDANAASDARSLPTEAISEPIDAGELEELQALIDETGADPIKLCRYFKVGALVEITKTQLPAVIIALESKRKRA